MKAELAERVPAGTPKTSALAIASAVTGMLAVPVMLELAGGCIWNPVAGPLLACTAIVCGSSASDGIRRSQGELTGLRLAKKGRIGGYACLILLILLCLFPELGEREMVRKARRTTTLFTVTSIQAAVDQFVSEYNQMPVPEGMIDTANHPGFAKALLGTDRRANLRGMKFLTIKEGRNGRNGLDLATSQIFDPWGSGYQVIFDTDFDKVITVTRGSKTEVLKDRNVAVFSPGPDKIAGTDDDVKTW